MGVFLNENGAARSSRDTQQQENALEIPDKPQVRPTNYNKGVQGIWRNTAITLEMIKWEHSIFALPFALTASVLAAGGIPPLAKLGWIVVCMVAARSAAMAFNRLVDAEIDSKNPRTAMRAIPAGLLSAKFVAGFVIMSCALFLFGAAMLNR